MSSSRSASWRRFSCSALIALAVPAFASCADDGVGDAARWSLQSQTSSGPTQTLQPEMSIFTAHVERLGCSGGVTGTVFDPQIALRDDEVVITFMVNELPDGPQLCPGNDQIAVEVDLGEPIGNRTLVDGSCVSGTAAAPTGACSDGSARWTPPVVQDCEQPAAPARPLDRSAMPLPREAAGPDGRDEFGSEVIEALRPIAVGADAGAVVANLRALRWTVTVVERSTTTTTITPDLRWDRLVVTTCGDVVDEITFD